MERRSDPRIKRRMTCEISTPRERSAGVIRDVSAAGLFVQTGANPAPNSVVELIFPSEGALPELRLEAGVARKREVTRRLQGAVPAGLGLEVLPPRALFEARIFAPARPEEAADGLHPVVHVVAEPDHAESIRAFRLRMKRRDHSESCVVTIRCQTEAAARARALARMGAGWKIAAVQPL